MTLYADETFGPVRARSTGRVRHMLTREQRVPGRSHGPRLNSLFSATVQITAESAVIGRVDHESQMFATVTVDAIIAAVHAAGRTLLSGGSCRTATHAIVPLRSKPGFAPGAGRPAGGCTRETW